MGPSHLSEREIARLCSAQCSARALPPASEEQHPELPWAVHEDLCAEVQQLLATMVSEKAERREQRAARRAVKPCRTDAEFV